MKVRLLLYIILMSLICNYLFVGGTYAWFVTSDNNLDGGVNVGLVDYETSSGFIQKVEPIVQGEEMLRSDAEQHALPITVTNRSTVPTKIKLEIKCTSKEDENDETETVVENFTDALNVNFINTDGYLLQPRDDGFLYYTPEGNPTADDLEFNPPGVGGPVPISLIGSVQLANGVLAAVNGDTIIKITVTYYARQSRYLNWQIFDRDVLQVPAPTPVTPEP